MLGDFFVIKRKITDSFKGIFSGKDAVLDIGCGHRPYYHKSIKSKIVCIDISQTGKSHIVGDASNLPVKKGKFDGIVCVNSFYYYKNPFKAVENFSHALKKGGKLAMVMPFIYPIHDAPHDLYRFTEYGIREILKDDFTIKEIKPIGGIFSLPAVFFHSLIKGIPLFFPKAVKPVIKFFTVLILYIPYLLAQLLGLLDFLDRTGRWPTYYFVLAVKK